MYKNIPIISIDEIINKAFSKSSNIVLKQKGSHDTIFKKKEIEKVNLSAKIIIASLNKVLNRFPSLNGGDAFTLQMIDILGDVHVIRQDLLALRRACSSIDNTRFRIETKMYKTRNKNEILLLRKEAYGKYKSILNSISKNIDYLNDTRQMIIEIPPITTEDYTVVIAGFPNVGKSSLLSKLTSTKPSIAPYPFTTTGINMGTFTVKYQRIFAIDTPGLLDRPFSERNDVELKAISAIKYLANVLVFVFDGSEMKHYSVEEQYSLLEDTKSRLGDIPIIRVQNKIDIPSEELDVDCKISAKDSTNFDEFERLLKKTILEDKAFSDMMDMDKGLKKEVND